MLSTNDYQERRQSHFAIHKLIIGAMSILLDIAFLASSQTVKADAVVPNTDSSNIQKTKLTTYSGLNSFLKSRDDDKTSKDKLATHPVIVEKNHTNVAKERPAHTVQTQADHIHQGNWNNINVTYNEETKELTLLGGTEDAPAIMQNGDNLEPLSDFLRLISSNPYDPIDDELNKITINGKIKAQGNAPILFGNLGRLTSIDGLSNLDTSNVTGMYGMFMNDECLTNLDVSKFDTSKVTNMWWMFMSCSSLTSLDLSNFNTSKVTDKDGISPSESMSGMFEGCSSLINLDLSSFNTSEVKNMNSMFAECKNLTSLNLSHFDTSKVTDMAAMFYDCPKLRWLSLGKSFKFSATTNLEDLPGKWINWGVANQQLPKGTKQWTSEDFVKNYNGPTDYDTYVRFENLGGPITVHYCDQNGNKIPNIADEQQYGNVGDSLIDKTNPNSILSFKRKEISGYNFDHAEINGQKVDLVDIKYTENPQTLTLFYVKANSDNNGGNNTNDNNGSDNSNGSNKPKDSADSNSSNNPGSVKIPVEFASNVTLRHNAYLYDSNGKRANNVTFKAGSIITVYGNKNINGRQFYILIDNKKKYYVAVGNAKPVSRKLKHNAYIYNKYGQRIKKTSVYKKRHYLNTFGDPVTIRGHLYFIIDNSRFVKAANFALKHPTKKVTVKVNNSGNKTIMHNAYLYNNQGNRANKIIISAGSRINTLNSVKINNRLYYKLEDGLYIAAGNVNAARQKLKHNAYIYSQYGNRIGKKVLKKRKFVKTYGYSVNIKHKKYYITAKNKFVKKANFR